MLPDKTLSSLPEIVGIVALITGFILVAVHFDTIKSIFKEIVIAFVASLLLLILINSILNSVSVYPSNIINGIAWGALIIAFIYVRWLVAPKKPRIN